MDRMKTTKTANKNNKKLPVIIAAAVAALALLAVVMGFPLNGDARKDDTATLLGVWTLVDMTGTPEAEEEMAANSEKGMKVQMAFSLSEFEMVTTYADSTEYDHETASYQLKDGKIVTNAGELPYELEGDTLKITTEGVTMVFTRSY